MDEKNKVTYRRTDTIGSRLLIAFLLIVLSPAIVISSVSAMLGLQSGQQQVINQLESVATLKEAEIETWLNGLKINLSATLLTGVDSVQRANILLQVSPGAKDYEDAHDRLQERFRRTTEQTRLFEEVFLMNLRGEVVLSTESAQEGKILRNQTYFREGLKGSYVQPPSYSLLLGRMSVVAAQPVVDQQGQTVGVLVGRASIATLNEVMLERTGLGETGETYLVGANHALLSGSDPDAQEEGFGIYVHTEGANAAIHDHVNGAGLYDSYRGAPVIGVYRWLPELQMALLAEQAQSEAFRAAYTTMGINVGVALVSVLIAWVASLAITRSIASPLVDLAKTAKRIADGDLDARTSVERRDEIGMLAATFNQMVESIQQAETALRKQTRALQESELRYRTLFETANDAIFMMEEDRFIACNPKTLEMFGCTQEQIIGRPPYHFSPKIQPDGRDSEEKAREKIELTLQGEPQRFDWRHARYDGTPFEAEVSLNRVELSAQVFLQAAVRDITERKRAEEELKRYHDRLEELVEERTQELEKAQAELVRQERLAAMGQLTATVAHEIRNPLGTVRTCVFSIGDAIERDEMHRVERALQLAERNIARCDRIITEMLDYTRDQVLQFEPTPIDAWLDALLDEQNIPEGIICTRELNAGIEIPMDGEYLRRAVINIVNNAVDALQDVREPQPNDEGAVQGLEHVKGRNRLIVSTHVVGDKAGFRLEIRVSDTGCGIPADVLSRVFEPLFSTKSFGVGLGLPVVKNIMQQHGGGVELESKAGRGTTVTLWLPIPDSSTG